MASTDLLDYNQIVEQSPSTGDAIPESGGLLTFNFRCDPNLSWDPSQSFFICEVQCKSVNQAGTAGDDYFPGVQDMFPMPLLRCFSSMSHIIDGVTVANSNQPHADKMMQEKYLQESTLSNLGNFEAMQTGRMIDDGERDHNLWAYDCIDNLGTGFVGHSNFGKACAIVLNRHRLASQSDTRTGEARNKKFMVFQPPFDFWTKHQRCSGGNHQIQLNLRPSSGAGKWGTYVQTSCVGAERKLLSLEFDAGTGNAPDVEMKTGETKTDDTGATADPLLNVSALGALAYVPATGGSGYTANAQVVDSLFFEIHNCRLLRRMVRYTIERPISVQEFNVTEMQFFHGQASSGNDAGVTQNFLLPSSTFGLAFYWRSSSDSQYSSYAAYPTFTFASSKYNQTAKYLNLNQFYFTYGGETYPSQRVDKILKVSGENQSAYGYQKLQQIAHQLPGVYNTDMERFNSSYGNIGYLDRLDAHAFFFPVAKHNNSDNSDLQVTWDGATDASVSLVVVAFYDARVELSYNQMNQLEKVTKTEWR